MIEAFILFTFEVIIDTYVLMAFSLFCKVTQWFIFVLSFFFAVFLLNLVMSLVLCLDSFLFHVLSFIDVWFVAPLSLYVVVYIENILSSLILSQTRF